MRVVELSFVRGGGQCRQLPRRAQVVEHRQKGEPELLVLPHDDLQRRPQHVHGRPQTVHVARHLRVAPSILGADAEDGAGNKIQEGPHFSFGKVELRERPVLQALKETAKGEPNRSEQEGPAHDRGLITEGKGGSDLRDEAHSKTQNAGQVGRGGVVRQWADASSFQVVDRRPVTVGPQIERRLLLVGSGRGGFLSLVGADMEVHRLQAHEVGANEEQYLASAIAIQRHGREVCSKGVLLVEHERANSEEDGPLEECDRDPIRQGPLPHPLLHVGVPIGESTVRRHVLRLRDMLHSDLSPGTGRVSLSPSEVPLLERQVLLC
mmetsp:Transcript_100563/g.290449  ORF Transcript_100563/g.290449 Transcript_100563/m.290449 type:complete len:322 (-) Transcript_100563:186-1151(-)